MANDSKLYPILVAVTVLILWLSALFVGLYSFQSWEEQGQFGDLFGSVNALFSGLAFAGLIYAILLQRQDLSLQRQELALQREEMAASRAELAAQVAAQKAMVRATIGQIRVAAEQARIAALKMQSERNTPGAPEYWEVKIQESANRIETIAKELEDN